MNLIINQVENNAVGIKAGNIFTLTYGSMEQVNVDKRKQCLIFRITFLNFEYVSVSVLGGDNDILYSMRSGSKLAT